MVVDHHSQINGIEVSPASEAAGKVGLMICGGVEFAAKRAEKAQIAFRVFGRELENLGDKPPEKYIGMKLILITEIRYRDLFDEMFPDNCYLFLWG